MELFLAPVKLKISGDRSVKFIPGTSLYFQKQLITPLIEFNCYYQVAGLTDNSGWLPVFQGESFDGTIVPYKWHVLQKERSVKLSITFYDDPVLLEASAIIHLPVKTINVHLVKKHDEDLEVDPLFHPLGSLLMVYLTYFSGGVMIHASGVKDCNNGYIFTGVSGVGKSTMSRLWCEKGATVINDDRLWLHEKGGKWHIFNTPMMHYAQEPLMAPLSKSFLLRQSPGNEYSRIPATRAATGLMSNCIQHLYNQDLTATHLDRVVDIATSAPVFDLGFKPDTSIVDLIRGIG